jgi:CBS domain-containing protein
MAHTETQSQQPSGRGRDLPVITVEIAGTGATEVISAVVCPRDHRVLTVESCDVCGDGLGPTNDLTEHAGFIGCLASDGAGESRWAAEPGASAADRAPVWAVMTRAVLAFRAELPLARARTLLLERELAAAPVVDEQARPIGIVTLRDIARAGEAALAGSTRVGDVMVRRAICVSERAPLSEAAALMAFEGVDHAPVVSAKGTVVGVVTAHDLVRWLAAQDDRGPRHLP